MTESIAPAKPQPGTPTTAAKTGRATFWLLLVGWAAQVGLRLLLGHGHTAPNIYPDEAGYLIGARWLAGGPGADLSGFTFYQCGYALLLAPAHLVSHDPATIYRLALGINALVGAVVFPLGYLLLRRCGISRMPAYPLAWAAALLPATTLFSAEAMADAILPALVLGWLLAIDRFLRHGGLGIGVVASLLAVWADATHARGSVILAVHALLLGAWFVRGRSRLAVLASFGVTGAGWAGTAFIDSRLSAALYPYGPRDLGGILADRVTSLDGQLWALSGAAGQIWAMISGTWGLAGLGLVAVITTVLRRTAPGDDRIMAGVLLTITAGIAYASSAALPDEQRVGNFAYGRYLTCVALIYALIGLAALLRAERAWRLIAAAALGTGAAALWIMLYAGERLRGYTFYTADFPEVGLLGGSYDRLRPIVTTVVACVLLATLWGMRRWGVQKLFATLLVLDLLATWLIIAIVTGHAERPAPVPGAPRGGVAIQRPVPGVERPRPDDIRPIPELLYTRVAYQVWWTRLRRFDPERGLPGQGFCAAVVFWPEGAPAGDTWPGHPQGWRYRPSEVNVFRWVVWYDPSCR